MSSNEQRFKVKSNGEYQFCQHRAIAAISRSTSVATAFEAKIKANRVCARAVLKNKGSLQGQHPWNLVIDSSLSRKSD